MNKWIFGLTIMMLGSVSFAGKPMTCRSLDKNVLLPALKIQLTQPDLGDKLADQEVSVSWDDKEPALEGGKGVVTKKVAMKLTQLASAVDTLSGSVTLGEDFGDLNVLLVQDSDNGEMIAVVGVYTDGPIGKQVFRCNN